MASALVAALVVALPLSAVFTGGVHFQPQPPARSVALAAKGGGSMVAESPTSSGAAVEASRPGHQLMQQYKDFDKEFDVKTKAGALSALFCAIITLVSVFAAPAAPPKSIAALARSTAAPVVVQIQASKPAPLSAPAAVAPAATAAGPPAAVAPAASIPAAVAPAAAPKAMAAPSPVGAEQPWARTLSLMSSNGLRAAADWLPQAEVAIEKGAPLIQKNLEIVVSGKSEEALPVVGHALLVGTEGVLKFGFEAFSMGLNMVADGLPAIETAAAKAADETRPALQNGARTVAQFTRNMAADLEKPDNVNTQPEAVTMFAPGLLKGVSAGVDMLGEMVPDLERGVGYVVHKAMPVVKSVLKASSGLALDIAKAPMPTDEQVVSGFKAVGVDPLKAGVQAFAQVGEAGRGLSTSFSARFTELAAVAESSASAAAVAVESAAATVAVAEK